jgi:hypothetical protein
MGEEGTIEHILTVMKTHESDPNIQINGCSALTNLAFDSGACTMKNSIS